MNFTILPLASLLSLAIATQRPLFACTALLFLGAFSLGILDPDSVAAEPAKGKVIASTFDEGREGWQIYDYNGGIKGGGNVFFPATWEKTGGVKDSGYIWADDSRWRIDTPENPHSILAFILYRAWVKEGPLDLRDAELAVHLRGDKLDLKEAQCLFWVLNNRIGTRWHLKASPLTIHADKWGERQTIVLKNDPVLWHRSWSRNPNEPGTLDDVLGVADSYGFSFVGFKEKVTGKFAMDELEFRLKR